METNKKCKWDHRSMDSIRQHQDSQLLFEHLYWLTGTIPNFSWLHQTLWTWFSRFVTFKSKLVCFSSDSGANTGTWQFWWGTPSCLLPSSIWYAHLWQEIPRSPTNTTAQVRKQDRIFVYIKIWKLEDAIFIMSDGFYSESDPVGMNHHLGFDLPVFYVYFGILHWKNTSNSQQSCLKWFLT